MELWIRSQDEMVLTRNVGLRIVIEQEGASIVDETNDYILGMYNTVERAIEVLNEIQKKISTYNTENGNYVYEMLPDDEDKEDEEDIKLESKGE